MKKAFVLSIFFISSLFIIPSLGQNSCIDMTSMNKCDTCKYDARGCIYLSSMVVWWKKLFSDEILAQGDTVVTIWLDGVCVGRYEASKYWPQAPAYGAAGSITCNKRMRSSQKIPFVVVITGKDDHVYHTVGGNWRARELFNVELH